jgi:hypothetical protein
MLLDKRRKKGEKEGLRSKRSPSFVTGCIHAVVVADARGFWQAAQSLGRKVTSVLLFLQLDLGS